MTPIEQKNKLEEARKLGDLIENRSLKARTLSENWSSLENKICDYIGYLENLKYREVDSKLLDYLGSYVTDEYERLTKFED